MLQLHIQMHEPHSDMHIDKGSCRCAVRGEEFSCARFTPAEIDIKPRSPNSISLKSKGVIPVAVLTIESIDATTIDCSEVRFGPNQAEPVHKYCGHLKDVDGDGDLDAIFHFNVQDTGITPGLTFAVLTAKLTDGTQIAGRDSIIVVK